MSSKGTSAVSEFFCSREAFHRSPFGAVAEGTQIHFKIRLPRFLGCSAAHLVLREDAVGESRLSSLFWCGMDGDDHECWECDFSPGSAGLYWYHFELDTNGGRRRLGRVFGAHAALDAGGDWQLTCYQKDFSTPDWLSGGVLYQIFPDRFFRSAQEKPPLPWGRILRQDWGGEPEWRPDEKGEITNSDYFGGDLKGIEEKLDYLKGLGVTCLYLNPIFEAHSNHRYNTADYRAVDPLLGSEEDFRSLCRAAARRGIRLLLDGVFSHTGSDSVYINKEGRYPAQGAFNTPRSPYFSWYRFSHWPDHYNSWWGFPTLPEVEETDPDYNRFVNGEEGVVRHWLRAGAAGWRLDVADELPDPFLDALREAAKAEKNDALILGEVWEDASAKVSYGHRRRYLLGRQLDSVMNYPFRDAILGFLQGTDASAFFESVFSILEHYPPQVVRLLMNHIGTHDTERALTVLAGEPAAGRGRQWQAGKRLSPEQRDRGLRLMRLASALQFTLPGVPCIYYGDEAGLEGYRDPFNRGCYPWGGEDEGLLSWYRSLGALRAACPALGEGELYPLCADGRFLAFRREGKGSALICAVNAGWETACLPVSEGFSLALSCGAALEGETRPLAADGCALLTAQSGR